MKSKFIKLFPWSVALLLAAMFFSYKILLSRSMKCNDELIVMVKQRDSVYRSLKHEYDSVVLIPKCRVFFEHTANTAIGIIYDSVQFFENNLPMQIHGKIFNSGSLLLKRPHVKNRKVLSDDSIIMLHNYSDSELRGEKVFTQSKNQ